MESSWDNPRHTWVGGTLAGRPTLIAAHGINGIWIIWQVVVNDKYVYRLQRTKHHTTNQCTHFQ